MGRSGKVDRDGLANYTRLSEETGVAPDRLRIWFFRNTAQLRDLSLSGLEPPVWVLDEAAAAVRKHLGVGD
jgi:hypothetical protein